MKIKTTKTYKFQVKNYYFDGGRTNHRKIEAAYKAASKREGEGWQVIAIDNNGDVFTTDGSPDNGFYVIDRDGKYISID